MPPRCTSEFKVTGHLTTVDHRARTTIVRTTSNIGDLRNSKRGALPCCDVIGYKPFGRVTCHTKGRNIKGCKKAASCRFRTHRQVNPRTRRGLLKVMEPMKGIDGTNNTGYCGVL